MALGNHGKRDSLRSLRKHAARTLGVVGVDGRACHFRLPLQNVGCWCEALVVEAPIGAIKNPSDNLGAIDSEECEGPAR